VIPDVEGVLSYTDIMQSAALADYARRLEDLGYRELWVPDLMGRETFITAGFLLANTTRLRVASGIASVYGRDALSTAQAARNGLSIYMQHTVYQQQWGQFGLGANEQANGGSDRFVDALVAWGDEAAIRKRAREHLDAGATRILVFDFNPRPDSALLPAVAPARS
jgi:hypothetical protein